MKVRIESIEEKKKTDGNPFWLVKSEGKTYYCFDKKIETAKVGDEIEVEIKERDGTDFDGNLIKRYYLQFPKEKFTNPKAVSTDAMLLSYAKDLVIALKGDKEKDLQEALGEIELAYKFFKNLLGGEK